MIDTLIKGNLPLLKTVFIAGAVAGVAVGGTIGAGTGYLVGTLFAKKSGEELRDDIANKFVEIFDGFSGRSPSSKTEEAPTYDV